MYSVPRLEVVNILLVDSIEYLKVIIIQNPQNFLKISQHAVYRIQGHDVVRLWLTVLTVLYNKTVDNI